MSPPLLIKGPGVPQGERAVVSSNRQPKLKPIQVADFYQKTDVVIDPRGARLEIRY